MKNLIKRLILKYKKNIIIDSKSRVNFDIKMNNKGKKTIITNSFLQLNKIGEGCHFENTTCYGNIQVGKFVSISGPGTVLHSAINKIIIGNFVSIGANVSIQEFNHNYNKLTTYAVNYNFFNGKFENDCLSKGDIIIEDDVWIGSNAVILSGVRIGRGAIIGASAVVTKDIPKYAIVIGNPAKIIRYRFTNDQINILERTFWWEMNSYDIFMNKNLFILDVASSLFKNECSKLIQDNHDRNKSK